MGLFDSLFGSNSTDNAVVEAVKENNKVRPITEQKEIIDDVNTDITIEMSSRSGKYVCSASSIDTEDGMNLHLDWNFPNGSMYKTMPKKDIPSFLSDATISNDQVFLKLRDYILDEFLDRIDYIKNNELSVGVTSQVNGWKYEIGTDQSVGELIDLSNVIREFKEESPSFDNIDKKEIMEKAIIAVVRQVIKNNIGSSSDFGVNMELVAKEGCDIQDVTVIFKSTDGSVIATKTFVVMPEWFYDKRIFIGDEDYLSRRFMYIIPVLTFRHLIKSANHIFEPSEYKSQNIAWNIKTEDDINRFKGYVNSISQQVDDLFAKFQNEEE